LGRSSESSASPSGKEKPQINLLACSVPSGRAGVAWMARQQASSRAGLEDKNIHPQNLHFF
jgi:hypothetical protein